LPAQEPGGDCRHGGVGGVHLATLARLGSASSPSPIPTRLTWPTSIASTARRSRTWAATRRTSWPKSPRSINPEVDLHVYPRRLRPTTSKTSWPTPTCFSTASTSFSIEARRLFVPRGPIARDLGTDRGPNRFHRGLAAVRSPRHELRRVLRFERPHGSTGSTRRFRRGARPRATHLRYLDLRQVNIATGAGPSAGLACQLASGVAGAEIVKILLHRKPLRPRSLVRPVRRLPRRAPLRPAFSSRNRHPWQRLKRVVLRRRMVGLGYPREVNEAGQLVTVTDIPAGKFV